MISVFNKKLVTNFFVTRKYSSFIFIALVFDSKTHIIVTINVLNYNSGFVKCASNIKSKVLIYSVCKYIIFNEVSKNFVANTKTELLRIAHKSVAMCNYIF